MSPPDQPAARSGVMIAQFAILGFFICFATAVITWIVHLVRLSLTLDDVPSASMGISLVAIPVFLTLAGIVTYVITGLVLDPEARGRTPEENDS